MLRTPGQDKGLRKLSVYPLCIATIKSDPLHQIHGPCDGIQDGLRRKSVRHLVKVFEQLNLTTVLWGGGLGFGSECCRTSSFQRTCILIRYHQKKKLVFSKAALCLCNAVGPLATVQKQRNIAFGTALAAPGHCQSFSCPLLRLMDRHRSIVPEKGYWLHVFRMEPLDSGRIF